MSGERALRPCGKLVATDADWERFDGGEGEHLCWCDNGSCDQGYTWEDRAVSLTARLAEVEQALRTVVAVAGNVVLVDDEADLLVPDWRAVVEVLREAIDTIRAALDKGEQP